MRGAWVERDSTTPGVSLAAVSSVLETGLLGVIAVRQPTTSTSPAGWFDATLGSALSPAERDGWPSGLRALRRDRQRLLGRLAAKHVVARLILATTGAQLGLHDIQVLASEAGRPVVRIAGGDRLWGAPAVVSIAHSGAVAAAIGSLHPDVRSVGIDLELRRSPDALVRLGFTSTERRLIEASEPAEQVDLVMRLWCAKEAAAKAWGTGLGALGGPRSVAVTLVDASARRMIVRSTRPGCEGTISMGVRTFSLGEFTVAAALSSFAPIA